jgi:hypothetical protein
LSDAKATSSSTLHIITVPAMASQCTSRSMRARLSTENTGAPLICSTSALRAASGAKAWRTVDGGRLAVDVGAGGLGWWPSAARAVPSRATHTPCSVRGERAGISDSAMRCVSPLGSRSSSGLTALPAGVPSSEVDSAIASRSRRR